MAIVAPSPKFSATFVDADGYIVPAVGYKLYAYTAGTSTPRDTYTDITLGSANTNPVVLDARGEADVWLNGAYKLVLKTDADVTVWTVDELRDHTNSGIFSNATLTGTLNITSTAITWSGNPTHSGNHTFTNNVIVKGNTQLGDQTTDTLRIDPNTVTWTNNPTHSGNHTWSGTQTFNDPLTIADTSTVSAVMTFNTTPAGKITASTYTPTLTAVANVGVLVARPCFYTRIGDIATVYGRVEVDPTSANTITTFSVSLPIASNLGDLWDLSGTWSIGPLTTSYEVGTVEADITNHDRATVSYKTDATVVNQAGTFVFAYRVI